MTAAATDNHAAKYSFVTVKNILNGDKKEPIAVKLPITQKASAA